MQKCSMLTRAANWQLSFLYQIRRFKIELWGAIFKHYRHENVALHTPFFYLKMNHLEVLNP